MKKMIVAATLFLFAHSLVAQKINGQWRGYFNGKGDIVLKGGDDTEFVLEIEVNGSKVTGYSYSYFQNRKYYVICSLEGTYYKSTHSMKVSETARIKGLTPPDWNDCLQTHILSYQKHNGAEELKGRWVSAAGQLSDCGLGTTTLTRKTVSKDLASFKKPKSTKLLADNKPLVKSTTPLVSARPVIRTPLVKVSPKLKAKSKPVKNQPDEIVVNSKPLIRDIPDIIVPESQKGQVTILPPERGFEKRTSEIIKTIAIEHSTFTVDLYDNGEIDGDSVSLFFNSKLLLSHKRLTEKPISITLEVSPDHEMSELTMYAENLGRFPPNTALMVVMDGEKRFEVRIASDLKKSGTIRFVHSSQPH
jgi:hypothetical protein